MLKFFKIPIIFYAFMFFGGSLLAQNMKDYDNPVVTKINHQLLGLVEEYEEAIKSGLSARSFNPENNKLSISNGSILIEAVAIGEPGQLAATLAKLGLQHIEVSGPVVSGYLPLSAVKKSSNVKTLNFIRPVFQPITNIGSVTSQGDAAQRSDLARTAAGVDGTGVKVGIISDSYNVNSGEAAGIASGDLPGTSNPNGYTSSVEVLQEGLAASIDEGRGMAEIIHDVAPGAELAFHSGFLGEADFANGIRELKDAGCQVIVDDIFIGSDPWFQDGLIGQAIDEVTAEGVSYFSSAINFDRRSYESEFRPAGVFTVDGYGDYVLHDFDPGPGVDVFQRITPGSASGGLAALIIVMQWDDPFASACVGCPGADTDLDFFISPVDFNTPIGIIPFKAATDNNIGQDALEVLQENIVANFSQYMVIGKKVGATGPNPNPGRIKYINPFGQINEYQTNSPTSVGHQAANGCIGVGAASYTTVPATKGLPPTIESFSSAGGTPILFDKFGNSISPEVRMKPEIVAPDDVNTSFFLAGRDIENDGFPNFNGTSAAAPHAAGVAALMLEASGLALNPADVAQILINSAIDMDDPFTPNFDNGFDFKTGYGFIQADDAVAASQNSSSASLVTTERSEFFVTENPTNGNFLHISKNVEVTESTNLQLALFDKNGLKLGQHQVVLNPGETSFGWQLNNSIIGSGVSDLFYLRIRSEKGFQQTIKLIKK